MAATDDDKDQVEDLSKEEEDQVYELLQTSASLLESAGASHKQRMNHSFGGSMDLEASFALGDDDGGDDDNGVEGGNGRSDSDEKGK